jgi:hypothetical protein
MDNFGSFFTVNGIPIYTYGLIGATTLLLTYSVFRDDSAPKESESSSSGYFTSPTESPAKEEEAESPKNEESPPEVKAEESPPPIETPAPTVGGKRKRTKRRRNKNKKTKRSRK